MTENGLPMSNVVVTFNAPSTGASGVFANTGTDNTTALTDVSGSATSGVFIANGTTGAYSVTASAQGAPSPSSFSLTNTTGPTAILAAGGNDQSAGINSTFAAPLMVKVVDGGQHPVGMAIVIFTAPATAASGKFADTGTTTTSATTDASGVATAAAFTANSIAGPDTVTAAVSGVSTPATFSLTNLAGSPATIVAESGTPQLGGINTAFAAPLVAAVFDSYSNPASGVPVTFVAPTTSASGTFANGLTTETDTTDANGLATSTVFTANGTLGGPYTVTAAVSGVGSAADFTLTNTLPFKTYVFYLSGQEVSTYSFYALAGAVLIDSAGNVLAGEQDYNDGGFGFTSPEPSGDTITAGTLNVSPTTGQGTLTLTTNNPNLGVGGTETLGVQFVNVNHALIVQFDGTATSSGSLDVQTLPPTLDGGYAFTLTGTDPDTYPVDFGGVFTISGGTSLHSGVLDTNDGFAGTPVPNVPLSGTLSKFDSFGRGTITSTMNYTQLIGSPAPVKLNYYVVGPKVLRIIDIDSYNNGGASADTAIGSAFGQGVNATNAGNASLGSSIFGIAVGSASNTVGNVFAAAGMLSPNSGSTFSGFGDEEETFLLGFPVSTAISGTYTIAKNGYGTLTIAPGQFGDISALGIYMTDPNLNLNDPNNTTSGLGGALLAEMDGTLSPSGIGLSGGTGFLIPQTDTSTASFEGTYAFGAQDQSLFGGEFDFVGVGTVDSSQALSGQGPLSDPFFTFGGRSAELLAKLSGKAGPDSGNPGRYTMFSADSNPLKIKAGGTTVDFDVALYQASGVELFWVNVNADDTSVFLGSLQMMGSLTGLPPSQELQPNRASKPW
ncbi:MAG: beta strand repeat-containing protein [Terriglobales bacterium]